MQAVSIDIGSTWTKGILVEDAGDRWRILRRAEAPTTRKHLSEGFRDVVEALTGSRRAGDSVAKGVRFALSSSAKGGLRIAAVGLVPSLTLEMARMTALSAGGKVDRVYSYALTDEDVARMCDDPPDIVLLAGGTDGGNRDYIVANAESLAASGIPSFVLYAGNRDCASAVDRILGGLPHAVAPNILPDLDAPNPEPAREWIRRIFLERVIQGRGLEALARDARDDIQPTPYAMYAFLEAMAPKLGPMVLIDMGGATTDVYSFGPDTADGTTTVRRGIVPPELTRTVEADLGMRVSARWLAEAAEDRLDEAAIAWAHRVADEPERLPDGENERAMDRRLARACTSLAVERHAGRLKSVYTPQGKVDLLTGKDLRPVTTAVGTGGFLARMGEGLAFDLPPVDSQGRAVLGPNIQRQLTDREYLLPLLANLARLEEGRSLATALDFLEERSSS